MVDYLINRNHNMDKQQNILSERRKTLHDSSPPLLKTFRIGVSTDTKYILVAARHQEGRATA